MRTQRESDCIPATKKELADFADSLAAGAFPSKLSSLTSLAWVKSFLHAGLITLQPEYDHVARKVVRVYHAITQPILQRRPAKPSLVFNAHVLAERWNEEFSTTD